MHFTMVYCKQWCTFSPALFNVSPTSLLLNFRYYLFDKPILFVGCFIYADEIILLSGSLNDLQSMLSVLMSVHSFC